VIRGGSGPALACAAALLSIAGPAWGQGTAPDSVPPDSARPRVVMPMPTEETAPGPLAPGARLVFTRDSMIWTNGYTVADLLADVPGVYVARTGFTGQPSPVFYAGRGPAGLEILYDGIPVAAVGADSVAVDPGRISLVGIRRVEVERHPAFLRVYLVSERSERIGARSYLRIVNGDFKTAGYAGLFQYRWGSGLGLDVSADYFDAKGSQGTTRDARWFDMRAALDWTPTPLLSARFQIRSLTLDREATSSDLGLEIPLRGDNRKESLLRLVASTRPGRQGWSMEAGLLSTVWNADSGIADTVLGERTVNRAFVGGRLAGSRGTIDLAVRISDYHTPFETELTVGWLPLSWVVLSGNARRASHDGDRTSSTAWGSLGLYRGAFSLVGDVRWADAVPYPVLPADTAQTTLDLGLRAGLASRRLTLHAGIERRDAFTPTDFGTVPGFPAFPPTPQATYAISDLSFTAGPITVAGWFAQPISGDAPAFQPPKQSRASFTFRSRFLRTFRSGAFDLKVQIALEAWSEGVAGVDQSGVPIPLAATSVGEAFLQFEIASFHAFYSLKNALRSREGFVPGFEYPRNRQTFGVKWIFRD